MKRVVFVVALVFGLAAISHAQRVRVRLDFPVNISIGAPGPPPFRGAIWIGPEWRWQRGHYVSVPGYWARPHRYRVYRQGYWRPARHGYVWVPGRWR